MDAAYAGVTAMLPEMRGHFAGIELVDSFNTNAHKWLLTNMDCSCLWVADSTHVRAALSLLPAYLRGRGNDLDFKVHTDPIKQHATHLDPAPSSDQDPGWLGVVAAVFAGGAGCSGESQWWACGAAGLANTLGAPLPRAQAVVCAAHVRVRQPQKVPEVGCTTQNFSRKLCRGRRPCMCYFLLRQVPFRVGCVQIRATAVCAGTTWLSGTLLLSWCGRTSALRWSRRPASA